MINELELNKSYWYKDLEEYFDNIYQHDPNIEWNETGDFEIGKAFITIDMSSQTFSFVMDGYNDKYGASYKLIQIQ